MAEHEPVYDTIIIGGGVAGLAAGVYCGRFKMKTLILGDTPGGTIALAGKVENYPGFQEIDGLDLAMKIREHALHHEDVKAKDTKATKIVTCGEGCFKVYTGDEHYHTKTIIFATGTEWRKMNVPGEKEFTSKGVHYCAMCDGPLYKNKIVGVVGDSDGAAKEGLLLTEYAKKVYVIMRGEEIRAEPINSERIKVNPKVTFVPSNEVTEVKGEQFVTKAILKNEFNGTKELELEGLFVEIGHIPLTRLAKDIGVQINERDEIVIDQDGNTNISGFFAAGDCCSRRFKQAITSVGEGVTAAYSAYHYISEHNLICIIDDSEEDQHNARKNEQTN